MKILSIFGTRPEAIKMAPVVHALERDGRFESRVCVTAQHRHMLDQVLSLFNIRPHWDLNLMQPDQDLSDLTARILVNVRKVLRDERPDVVLVHGDTTTCFASALAAFHERVRIGHVEAGLRTRDLRSPFPEEANRTLVARLAEYNFAPTCQARENLRAEGIREDRIEVTGNTVVDALLSIRRRVKEASPEQWRSHFGDALIERLADPVRRLVLITSHRRENFGHGLVELCTAIRDLAQTHREWEFVYPVHPNPNVQKPVAEILRGEPNVQLIAPQNYEPFVWLMDKSDVILTDSGGIQEEALSLGKPVLVMRETTERPEALLSSAVRLVGTSHDSIVGGVTELVSAEATRPRVDVLPNPFGDGAAAGRIVEHLAKSC